MSKSRLSTEPYKGVRDFYPEEQALLNYILSTWRRVAERFGYVEYGASILEPSELYKAKGADNEEIINEQTYTFIDRGEREVTLRPEMTPTVARMVAAKRREFGYPLRWYSVPNCFRYERPQRGRLREFWQLNVDVFGSRSTFADAEIIKIAYETMLSFKAKKEDFEIRVNDRRIMEDALKELAGMNEEEAGKTTRLLDRFEKERESTGQKIKELVGTEKYEKLLTFLNNPDLEELKRKSAAFDAFQITRRELLNQGVETVYKRDLVRGFSYYTGIIFEVFDKHPDNNRALFGGGRYDNLTQLFDGEQLPGVGFGMGDETIRLFLESRGLLPSYLPPTKLYIAIASEEVLPQALQIAAELRSQGVSVATDFGERKLSDQIKTAAKHQIPYLLVVGQDELASGTFMARDLRSGLEEKLSRAKLGEFFLNL